MGDCRLSIFFTVDGIVAARGSQWPFTQKEVWASDDCVHCCDESLWLAIYIERGKLQALVYDILPSTTAVFSYAIASWKLSANKQFFVGAQTVVSLLQTTQIKQGMSFTATNKVYTSTNKTTIVWIETELFYFLPGCGCVSCLCACFGARLLLQSY